MVIKRYVVVLAYSPVLLLEALGAAETPERDGVRVRVIAMPWLPPWEPLDAAMERRHLAGARVVEALVEVVARHSLPPVRGGWSEHVQSAGR